MMQFIKSNAVLVGAGVVVLAGVFIYFNFFANSSSNAALLSSTGDNAASPISQELLVTLSNLHTIKLDTSIFTNPVYVSLTNFGVQIPPEAAGRRNPFAPLGSN